jgi:hypothetical protein
VKKARRSLEVGPDGSLTLPPDLARRWGLEPGARLVIEEGRQDLRLLPPVSNLRRVYVEVTNTCSLGCRTCIRNVWDEQPGWLSLQTWGRILAGLAQFPARPEVFFGGFGEPLSHPRILEMILEAKALGCRVDLITSGVPLTPEMSTRLIDAELICSGSPWTEPAPKATLMFALAPSWVLCWRISKSWSARETVATARSLILG